MACDIAIGANRAKVCNNLQGGNEEFYFFNYIDNAFTVVAGQATAVAAGLTVAYKYVIQGDGNTFTQSSVTDTKVGTKVNTQTLVGQLKQINAPTNVELDKLASGTIAGVIKDRNGVYHWFAKDSVNVTATIEAVTGAARTDFNGYNVTLVAETLDLAPILDAATVTAFLAIVV
tara:strand:+ start:4462 stop:4983 length:522 start_codon:yes stop_codon:yes gene_type:complete